MPQQGYYRLEHSALTRKHSGPMHLRAHANYCANSNKCDRVVSVNLSTNRYDIDKQLAAHDQKITRANGRIAEKIQFCHPVQMSPEHRYQATRRFLWRVTFQGQIKAVAFHHDQDTHNPHAHCIILDVSSDGTPVGHFGRSGTYRRQHSPVKGNPTEWFRRMWEEECNGVLEEHGYEQRIDRRNNIERGLQEAQKHRGYDNDNRQPLPEMDVVETVSSELEEPDAIVWDQPDDDAEIVPPDAPSNEYEPEIEEPIPDEDETLAEDEPMALPVSKRIENACKDLKELRILNHRRQEAVKLRNEWTYWRSEAQSAREKAELAQSAHEDAIVRTETANLEYQRTHRWGFRRGIDFKLGPIHIRTPGIAKAIQAEAEKSKAEYREAVRAANFRDANNHANYAGQKVFELEQKVAGIEEAINLHERINGELHDFDNAEVLLNGMVADDLKRVTPNQVLDAYENEELSVEQATELLEIMGYPDLIELIEAPTPAVRH